MMALAGGQKTDDMLIGFDTLTGRTDIQTNTISQSAYDHRHADAR